MPTFACRVGIAVVERLTQIEGMVMRSVQTGRDIGALTKDLQ